MEPYTREMAEQYREAQERHRKQEQQRRQEAFEKESAKRAWLADGGDEHTFLRQWPAMRDESRRKRVADADRQARQAMRSGSTSRL